MTSAEDKPTQPAAEAAPAHGKKGSISRNAVWRLMAHRNYRLYTMGDGISLLGSWTQRIAVAWLTWELTQSGAWLGIVAFADLFPSLVFSPIGGVIADRGDPRRISMITQSMAAFHAMVLFALTATGWMDVWLLVILVFLRGTLAAINQPARLSLVPSLLPRTELPAGLALNSVIFNTARFVGPAIAGAVIVASGAEGAFALNAISYVVLIWALWRIDPKPVVRERSGKRDMLSQIGTGYTYVSHHAGIGPLLFIFGCSTVLVRPIAELLPGFADGIFGQGAQGLAWMASTIGIGAVLGGMVMVRSSNTRQLVLVAVCSIVLLSASAMAFALSPSYWIALLLLFVFGFGNSMSGISSQTLTQYALEDAMRGRVMSLYGAIFRGGPAIGALLIGIASDHFGLRIPAAVAAGLCLLVAVWAVTQRRNLERHLHKPTD